MEQSVSSADLVSWPAAKQTEEREKIKSQLSQKLFTLPATTIAGTVRISLVAISVTVTRSMSRSKRKETSHGYTITNDHLK